MTANICAVIGFSTRYRIDDPYSSGIWSSCCLIGLFTRHSTAETSSMKCCLSSYVVILLVVLKKLHVHAVICVLCSSLYSKSNCNSTLLCPSLDQVSDKSRWWANHQDVGLLTQHDSRLTNSQVYCHELWLRRWIRGVISFWRPKW